MFRKLYVNVCSVWGEWNDWSKCSVTCMTGTRTRTRNCYGDNACDGQNTGND